MFKKISSSLLCLALANSFVCQSVSSTVNNGKGVDSNLSGNNCTDNEKLNNYKSNKPVTKPRHSDYESKLFSKKIAIAAGVTSFTAVLLTFYIMHKLKSEPETDINKTLENGATTHVSNGQEDSTLPKKEEEETGYNNEKKKPEEKHDADINTPAPQSTEKPRDIGAINIKQGANTTPLGTYLDPILYLLLKIPVAERLGFLSAWKEFWTFKKGYLYQPLKLAFMFYLFLRLIIGFVCPAYHVFMLIVMFFTKIFQGIYKWSDLLEHSKALVITALLNCAPITSSIIGGTCDKIVPLTFDFKPEVKVDEKFDKALGIILGYNARFLNRAVRVPSFDAY